MNKILLMLIMVFGSVYIYAATPLMDDHQLKAIEANEKIVADCMEEMKRNKNSNCLSTLAFDNKAWPIPKRGTKEYCQEQYANLSVDELEGKFTEIKTVYDMARYFPIGSAAEPERGEITKGDLNSEIRCISDYIQLKK